MEDDQVIYVQSIHDFEEGCEEEEKTASDTFSIERDLFGFDENDHENAASVSSSKSLKHQFLLNSALETMNHGIQPKMAANVVPKILKDDPETHSSSEKAHAKMYQGLICVMENFRFYGYKTNTGIKIVVGVKNNILPSDTELCKSRDETIQYFLTKIHEHYVHHQLNPFSQKHGQIRSKSFQLKMREILQGINKNEC